MFGLLGRWSCRGWPLMLVIWVALAVLTTLLAPPWHTLAQHKEFAFLPPQSPSLRGDDIFQKAFPGDQSASNVVLVVHRLDGTNGHLEADKKFIEDVLEPKLRQIADAEGGLAGYDSRSEKPLLSSEGEPPSQSSSPRSIIARIRTPNALGTGALLVSPDGQVLLVVLELTTEFLSSQNWPTITRIQQAVDDLGREREVPPGLEIAVTGSALIGRDHTLAQLQSAKATGTLTVVLVIVLLVLIYRAPLLALIPLVTVYLAVQISLNLLAMLAGAGYLTLFQGIQIYITILGYGAGVDYCLFLTARYKEELDVGKPPPEAVCSAINDVGAALTASAFTVIGGIGMMVFAQFGKFREAGYAIPLTLFMVLCATLTFSPALLRLAGRWAFWPQRRQVPSGTPEVRAGFLTRVLRGEELRDAWATAGRVVSRRPGTVWLATILVMLPFAVTAGCFYNRLSYDVIGDLPADAPSVVGTRVLTEHFAAGIIGPTKILLVIPKVDFSSSRRHSVVAQVTRGLEQRRQELGLADVRSLTSPLGLTAATTDTFAGSYLSDRACRAVVEQLALEHYVTDLGEKAKIGMRFDLVLDRNPFTRASADDLNKVEDSIRALLPPDLAANSQLYVAGPTASVRDLQDVTMHDRVRLELLVLLSVFAILVLLLRQLFVPIYLLASVLFSYYVTLGATFLVFWLLDPHGFVGIDWKVAIFLFTILIAVGEDYNIFLISRICLETRRLGPVRGITEALVRTGPIISSCGLIMAGTFGSLLAGSLAEMKQLGFALAFGILLDTFVVRPILVPAFLILLATGRLTPANFFAGKAPTVPRERQETACAP